MNVTKDNLAKALWENYKDLLDTVDQINADVEYNQDLITLRDKHKKPISDISEEISRLIAKRDVIIEILDNYEATFEYREILIDELREECEC